jgi:hypothetical protein
MDIDPRGARFGAAITTIVLAVVLLRAVRHPVPPPDPA